MRRVPQISGGRRRRHRMAAIEAPGMIARIPLIGKLGSAAVPFQSYFVFGHGSYMECGQALGNRLFRYIQSVDTTFIMAADAVAGYIQGLLDGVQFKRSSYVLDRASRQATVNRLFAEAMRPAEPDRGMNSGMIARLRIQQGWSRQGAAAPIARVGSRPSGICADAIGRAARRISGSTCLETVVG